MANDAEKEDRAWRLFFYPLAAIALCGSAFVLFAYGIGQSIVLVVVGALCLLAPRLKDLVKLEVGVASIKAEMAQAVADARATVEQLHLLAAELGKQIVRSAQAEGRWGGRSRKERAQVTTDTAEALRKLGMNEPAVREVIAVERPFLLFDYAGWAESSVKPAGRAETDKWNEFFARRSAGIGSEPSPEALRQFLQQLSGFSAETEERLQDYEYYFQSGMHRRPDVWLRGRDE